MLRADLAVLNDEVPTELELPLDPNIKLGRLKIAKCKYMDSKKLPLWLVFQNADPQVALGSVALSRCTTHSSASYQIH